MSASSSDSLILDNIIGNDKDASPKLTKMQRVVNIMPDIRIISNRTKVRGMMKVVSHLYQERSPDERLCTWINASDDQQGKKLCNLLIEVDSERFAVLDQERIRDIYATDHAVRTGWKADTLIINFGVNIIDDRTYWDIWYRYKTFIDVPSGESIRYCAPDIVVISSCMPDETKTTPIKWNIIVMN